jgi:ABC-2 type transport system ATP-binding protein
MNNLSIENLSFSYRKEKDGLFDNLSFSITDSGVYGLLGKNGAGKSTLIYLMSGLLTPQKGDIEFNGIDVRRRLPQTLSEIYVVPEEYDLPAVSLSQYVHLNAPFYPRFSEADMYKYLELFEMEKNLKLQSLSMGQKKKVLMSFALATHTKVLLMDEPTNGLDIPGKSQFRKFIASGMTEDQIILISTHQVRDVEQMLDHVIIIDRSRILLNQPTSRICECLSFVETDNDEMASQALYAMPSVGGNTLMLAGDGESDSRLNLEMLFNGTLAHPAEVAALFEKDNK